jgi:hypothetical protein
MAYEGHIDPARPNDLKDKYPGVANLVALGRTMIETAQTFLKNGKNICPIVAVIDEEGETSIFAIDISLPNSAARQYALSKIAGLYKAKMLMFFSDGWVKDPVDHEKRIGEALTASFNIRGELDGIVMVCQYTRPEPESTDITFGEISEGGGSMNYPLFGESEVVH